MGVYANIFSDKRARQLVICFSIVLLVAIFLGQLAVRQITSSYRSTMLSHDQAIAGRLALQGIDDVKIANAFTAVATPSNTAVGRTLLASSGYDDKTDERLLTDIYALQKKYSLIGLFFSLGLAALGMWTLLIYLNSQESLLSSASSTIMSFLEGKNVRLPDKEEGAMSKLFFTINSMATSLSAHVEKEKTHKEFLRNTIEDISHQLKTPLAALMMYNEIMQDADKFSGTLDVFLAKSKNEMNRMEVLIKNLLKLAKFDAGTVELEKRSHRVAEFIDDVVQRFSTRASSEHKELVFHCDTALYMEFDDEWLMEALSNLVKNALDHTPENGRVAIECLDTPVMTQITVMDTGSGIHPDDIHHIFKRFYRSRYSKDTQGTGIGLTLVKSIVDAHEGTVFVESSPGKGAVFHMCFPKLTNV